MTPFRLRRADLVVGMFVLAAFALLLVAAMFVAYEKKLFERKVRYYTTFKDGYGITPGNAVTIAGIDVGQVREVVFTQQSKVNVVFDVRQSFASRVRQDSIASVKSPPGLGGIIGGTGIKIKVGTEQFPAVPAGGMIKSEEPMGLEELLAMLKTEELRQKLSNILDNAQRFVHSLGAEDGPMQKIIANSAELTERIKQGKGSVGRMVSQEDLYQRIMSSLETVNRIMANVEKTLGHASETMEKGPEMAGKVGEILDNVNLAVKNMSDIVVRLGEMASMMKDTTGEVPVLIADLEAQMKKVDEILGSLRRNWLIRMNIETKEREGSQYPAALDEGAAQ